MYINKALIYGNLTRDPEARSLPSGKAVVSFSIATNRVWKDETGAKKEAVEFHNVVAFGRTADLVAQYLKKGSAAFVEGRLQTRGWEDKNGGGKKYRTEIVADTVQFGPRGVGSGGSSGSSVSAGLASGSTGSKAPELDTIEYPEEDNKLEEIPF